jgi:hypothetical protein
MVGTDVDGVGRLLIILHQISSYRRMGVSPWSENTSRAGQNRPASHGHHLFMNRGGRRQMARCRKRGGLGSVIHHMTKATRSRAIGQCGRDMT